MSNAQHTQGPWTFKPHKDARVYGQTMCNIYTLADNTPPLADHVNAANARRIVACVNACQDMSEPAAVIADLRADRDEAKTLRHALREIIGLTALPASNQQAHEQNAADLHTRLTGVQATARAALKAGRS